MTSRKALRLCVLAAAVIAMAGCSSVAGLAMKGLSGGTTAAANVQTGQRNEQTIGRSDNRETSVKAGDVGRDVVTDSTESSASTKAVVGSVEGGQTNKSADTAVDAKTVGTVDQSKRSEAPWFVWFLVALGWFMPSPAEIVKIFRPGKDRGG